jgi:hypothetical protein
MEENDRNKISSWSLPLSVIRICFGFRISIFEFSARPPARESFRSSLQPRNCRAGSLTPPERRCARAAIGASPAGSATPALQKRIRARHDIERRCARAAIGASPAGSATPALQKRIRARHDVPSPARARALRVPQGLELVETARARARNGPSTSRRGRDGNEEKEISTRFRF